LKNYLKKFYKQFREHARGILVHGGARKLQKEIRSAAYSKPKIELVQFNVRVDFLKSE
jgi:hypothetical protein